MPLIHRIFLSVIFILFIMVVGCADENKAKLNEYIENARQFMAQKKTQTAIIEYRNAINIDPDNDIVLFELAEAYVLNGQVNSAIRYYNLAAKANPETTLPLLRLAQVFMQTGQLLDARDHVNKVMEINPTSLEAYHLMAGVQIKERDIKSAIATLNKALSIDEKNTKTYVSLARLYLENKNPDRAEQAYIKAINYDSSLREAYMGLVQLYGSQQKWGKAEQLLKDMLETPGIRLNKLTDLAKFYQGLKKFELAEEYFLEAIKEAPDRIEPLINLSEHYTRMNEEEKAVTTIEKALENHPDNILILTSMAQVYLQFNRLDEAENTVKKALSIKKNSVDALFQQGRIFMAQENFKDALDLFDQVIDMNQVNAKAYYLRALCIEQRGASERPEQKIFRAAAGMLDKPEEFEKNQIKINLQAAITIDSDFLDARLKLLEVYILEKNIAKAKEQMKEVFKLTSPDIRTMTLLSGIHLLEKDFKGAEKILTNIIQNRPAYFPAYIRLGTLYNSMSKPDLAMAHFQKAFDMEPDHIILIKMMADIYIDQKKYKQALELVETYAVQSSPDKEAFFNNLKGEIYLADREIDQAFKLFKKAADKEIRFILPRMYIARLLARQGNTKKALEQYKEIEAIKSDHIPALISIGMIYDTFKDIDNAELYYRKVLEFIPQHTDAANNLAFILSERKGATDEAFKYASIAREKAPKDPNVLDTMGWVLYHKANYLNALSEFEESLKINPDSALTCFHYGMALYQNQEFEKARLYFKKALDIDPGFKDAEMARRMLN